MNNDIRKVFIYALLDPRPEKLGDVRYIGKTINPAKRLWGHIHYCNKNKTHKDAWIRKLLKLNLKPTMQIIEEVTEFNWEEKERFYIDKFLKNGCKLTNLDSGGNGGFLPKEHEKRYKKVAKINIDTGGIIDIYSCISDAAAKNNHKSRSRISDCCNGKSKTSKGFFWKFVDDEENILNPKIKKEFKELKKRVAEIKDGKIIKTFDSITKATQEEGLNHVSLIWGCCSGKHKQVFGKTYRYIDIDNQIIEPKTKKFIQKEVLQIDLINEQTINVFKTIKEASDYIKLTPDSITGAIKRNGTCAGYKWKIIKY